MVKYAMLPRAGKMGTKQNDKLVEEALTLVCVPCYLNGVRTRYARMMDSCPVCRRDNKKADKVVKVSKVC
jgi:hypothetical protein